MTARVLVVRHAEQIRQAGDPGLSERGRQQAEAVSRILAPLHPVALVSSPLARAQQTAAPTARECGLTVATDPRLRERVNLDEGRDVEEFLRAWARSTRERDWQPPGGRSSRRTGEEMRAALDEAAVEAGTVVIVSHGGATTDLLRTLLGDDEVERRAPGLLVGGPVHGAITELDRTSDGWTVGSVAATDHLDPALRPD